MSKNERTNLQRARDAQEAMRAYEARRGPEALALDPEELLTDFLADLMHLYHGCPSIDFDKSLRLATMHFQAEQIDDRIKADKPPLSLESGAFSPKSVCSAPYKDPQPMEEHDLKREKKKRFEKLMEGE